MDLDVRIQEGKMRNFVVTAKGRIDSDTYLAFDKKIHPAIEKKAKSVVINMEGVNYISSAGLGVIFSLMKKLKEHGGEIVLCGLQPQIKKVFEVIKALPSSNIFSSIEEADRYLEHIMDEELKKKGGGGDRKSGSPA